jgi:hypothetical protein
LPRKAALTLTVKQRRRQIIDLLAGSLARMPDAIDVQPARRDSSHEAADEVAQKNLPRGSKTALELSAN